MRWITSRQVRNAQLRAMGIRPTESYHFRLHVGDEIQVEEATEVECRKYVATVVDYEDHGHYAKVVVDNGSRHEITLHREGPRHYGVVACVLKNRKFHALPPNCNRK